MSKTAYITTPIYYPSGKPHLGSAYTSLAADIYARFKRLGGYDVKFLTGTDEHGLKLLRAAEKEGKSPQAYVDDMSALFRTLTPIMNLSNDDFIRTTEERHKKTAQYMWQKLEENGYIYKDSYAGWYCVSDEAYYTEEELKTNAQGEKCSPVGGNPVEWMEEESYFFKLSAFEEQLLDIYDKNPHLVQPTARMNEVKGFMKQGLQDISISRTTFDWGVPVPGDDKHVMYVWIDALTNYLSAINWPDGDDMKYWPATHLVGKDVLRFHAVYWPAMLLGAGFSPDKLPTIFAHGWWTVEGEKMSKSKGNVVDPEQLTQEFGVDQVRYFLMREVPFGNDGDFSRAHLIQRINTDLANDLGNLFQRVLSMVAKNCEGKVPDFTGPCNEDDKAFLQQINKTEKLENLFNTLAFDDALKEIWEIISASNKYMDAQQPWMLKKENPQRMAHVLRVLMEGMAYVSLYIEPYMPESAKKMQALLAFEGKTLSDLGVSGEVLHTGKILPAPEGIFPRIESKEEAA